MARAESKESAVLDALGQGQVDQARYLLSNGCPLNLGRATEVVIERGQCEALQFLINEYNIDVNTNFLLHRALFFQHENMVRLLVELGADVNQCQMTKISKSMRKAVKLREDIADCSVENIKFFLPLQLSLRCGLELMSFLLHSGANVNKQNGLRETTLMSACAESVDVQRVEFLLHYGAQTNLKNLKAETGLHLAAETGNSGKVQLLIDHGADIEAKTNTQKTALMYACDRSLGVDCLMVLLQNGANLNAGDQEGETAVHLLAELGQADKLRVLVQHNANLNAMDCHDRTPLISACASDIADVACVRFLLQNNALAKMRDINGQSACHIAANKGDLEKLQMLLQYNACINAADYKDQTPLMAACASDIANVACVRFLLQNNASPNVTDRKGQSAIHILVDKGNLEKLQELVQHNADVNTLDLNGQTPLMAACSSDTANAACVRFLLQNNALPNLTNNKGQSALHIIADKGNLEKLEELVHHNADVNALDLNDQTPLMAACSSDIADATCVKCLLQHDALPEWTDKSLHMAADKGNLEKLQELIKHNVDVNATDDSGQTPLMKACASDTADIACVRFLLENNATANRTDITGQSVLHILANKGNLEKLQVLVQHNANVNAVDRKGQTPLTKACVSDTADVACVRFLIENKALLSIQDLNRHTALHLSVRSNDVAKTKLLLQHRVQLPVRSGEGSPMPLRLKWKTTRSEHTFSMLFDTLDFLNFLTDNSETALDLAGNKEMIKLLTHYGAKYGKEAKGETPSLNIGNTREIAVYEAADTEDMMRKLQELVKFNAHMNTRDVQGQTPLMVACASDIVDVACVRFLLQNNALPNMTDNCCRSALHIAAYKGCLEKLQVLIQYNADVNARDEHGLTPLMVACASDITDVACVRFLLQNNALPNMTDKDRRSALHIVAEKGRLEKLQVLIQYNADVNAMNGDKQTPLMVACASDITDVACVRFLLQNNALPDLLRGNGLTAFDVVSGQKERERFQVLVQSQADVKARAKHVETPLMTACAEDFTYKSCGTCSLQTKAMFNTEKGYRLEALCWAAKEGNLEELQVLVQHNADVNATDRHHQTPLMVACASDTADVACVKFLLENKALPGLQGINGNTALHVSVRTNNVEKTKLLLQHRTQPQVQAGEGSSMPLKLICNTLSMLFDKLDFLNIKTKDGKTALDLANEANNTEMIELLTQYGAQCGKEISQEKKEISAYEAVDTEDLVRKLQELAQYNVNMNTRDVHGQTPLMAACASDIADVACVRFLLQNNALPNMTDRRGQTALHIAAKEGNLKKLEALIHFLASVNIIDKDGRTPLMVACGSDFADVTCVRFLLENNALPYMIDIRTGQTALHIAASKGDLEKLQALVKYKTNINSMDVLGETQVVTCAGDTAGKSIVIFTLKHSPLEYFYLRNIHGKPTIHTAANETSLKKLQVLLQVNADDFHRTPLMVACTTTLADITYMRSIFGYCNFFPDLPYLDDLTVKDDDIDNDSSNGDDDDDDDYDDDDDDDDDYDYFVSFDVDDDDRLPCKLVQYNADINIRNTAGETPLMVACASQTVNVECVKFLLENNALPNLRDKFGRTALHRAAQAKNRPLLRILLHQNADVNIRNRCGETPLMQLCSGDYNDVKTMTFLLKNQASLDLHNVDSNTELHVAVDKGHLEQLRVLLQVGANVNVRSVRDKMPTICKHRCKLHRTKRKHLLTVPSVQDDTLLHRLIRTAALVRAVDAHEEYRIISTEYEGGCLSILCAALAGVRKFVKEYSAQHDHLSITQTVDMRTSQLKLLIKFRANIEARTHKYGETAYLLAARALDLSVIDLLKAHGANIRTVDSNGRNAIMLAVISTHYWMMLDERAVEGLKCLRCLIDQGVPVNHRDKAGRTPLMIAAHYANVKILKLLLKAGADVHAVRTERIGTASLTGADVRTGTIKITAICNLLEKQIPDYKKNMACVKELIRHGAVNSLPERFNNLLHDLIEDDIDKRKVIELLLRYGMAPTMSGSPPTSNSALSLSGPYRSPLMVALHDGFVPVIKFLLDNLILCPCDISAHSYHKLWQKELIAQNEMQIFKIMDKFYSEPKSLFQLSFVQVSYALGGAPKRMEKVSCLPVPEMVKEQLMWRRIDVPMDFTRDA